MRLWDLFKSYFGCGYFYLGYMAIQQTWQDLARAKNLAQGTRFGRSPIQAHFIELRPSHFLTMAMSGSQGFMAPGLMYGTLYWLLFGLFATVIAQVSATMAKLQTTG